MAITWRVDRGLLDRDFSAAVDKLLSESPFGWYVIQGRRTSAEQTALYNSYKAGTGGVAARPGASSHEFGFGCDVCLDSAPDMPGLQPDWNVLHRGWEWLFKELRWHPLLESGINFQDPDGDHIQMRHWRSLVNLKA